tara:strand:- start:19293 stop:19448 length:156 start_codon:yes stop_codon:yes gene_type:complete
MIDSFVFSLKKSLSFYIQSVYQIPFIASFSGLTAHMTMWFVNMTYHYEVTT